MNTSAIVIWTRVPNGSFTAKTRIGKAIGNQSLANELSLKLARIAIKNVSSPDIDIYLYHQPVEITLERLKDLFNYPIAGKSGYDQGLSWLENVTLSIMELFERGYRKVIFLTSDCPYFDKEYVQKTLEHLDRVSVVLCPAKDKGINSIGIVADNHNLNFLQTNNVVSRTAGFDMVSDFEGQLQELGISYQLLPSLPDIDTVSDLNELHRYMKTMPRLNTEDWLDLRSFLDEHREALMFTE